jgi:hypothetical protein
MSVDTDVTDNAATTLGQNDPCIQTTAGSTVIIDVTIEGIPAYDDNGTPFDPADDSGGMIAFAYNLSYTVPGLSIEGENINFLLTANPGSSLFPVSDGVPDSDGTWAAAALDSGTGVPESGSGVLNRLTISVASDAPTGVYLLVLSENAHLDANGFAFSPLQTNHGAIAVGTTCPAGPFTPPPPTPPPPTPTPLPTPGPSPTPSPTPTLTPTPSPTATPSGVTPVPSVTTPSPTPTGGMPPTATPQPPTPTETATPTPEPCSLCMQAMSIDADPTGNTATALDAHTPCIAAEPGTTVTVDVTSLNIPPYNDGGTPDPSDDFGGIIAFSYVLLYEEAALTVQAQNSAFLLSANPGSSLFNAGDPVPDADASNTFAASVLDTGAGLPEGGSGVLDHLTISIAPGAAPGLYTLQLQADNSVHLDVSGAAFLPLAFNNAALAVGLPCP